MPPNSHEEEARCPTASTRSSRSWGRARPRGRRPPSAPSSGPPRSLEDLRVAEVVELDVKLDENKIVAYRAKLKVSFKYHDDL
jgi:hypothetical protein